MLVGFAEEAFSPPDPIGHALAGYITRKSSSRGLHDDVYIRVLLIEADKTVAIASLDLLAVDEKITSDLRRVASRILGNTYVLVAATHTHSAPATLFSNRLLSYGSDVFREDYYQFFLEKAEKAFERAALAEQAKATLHKTPITGVATDRNDPRKPIDNTAKVLKLETPSGAILLLNYAVHPTVLGPKNLLISSDIIGYTVRYLRERGGLRGVVFVNSACANVSTRFTRRSQTFEEAERLGKLLAEQVLSAIHLEGQRIDVTAITINTRNIEIEYEDPAEKVAELEKNLLKLVFSRKSGKTRALVETLEAILTLRKLSKTEILPRRNSVEVSWIKADSQLGILALPFEVHSELAKQFREHALKMGVGEFMLFSYANGYNGYIAPLGEVSYEALSQLISRESYRSLLENILSTIT